MKIVILLYKGFTALDVTGAYEILSRLPGAEVKFASKEKGIIEGEYAGMKMVAGYRLDEINDVDILLIPGSTYAFMEVVKDAEILQQIRRIHEVTKWTVSVCTGSVLLAAAGLLAGKKATSHWAVLDRLPKFGAQPISERFVQDGKIITAAGVSAGIDMGLHLASLISDEDYSQMLQLVTEYYPEPPTKIGNASFVSQEIKEKTRSFLQSEISKMSSSGLY